MALDFKITDIERLSPSDQALVGHLSTISRISPDPSTKIACIIRDDQGNILTAGANTFPEGIEAVDLTKIPREEKYRLVEHTERIAIFAANRRGIDLNGSTMLIDHFPCSACARTIIAHHIKRIFVDADKLEGEFAHRWQDEINTAYRMFCQAGIEVLFFRGKHISTDSKSKYREDRKVEKTFTAEPKLDCRAVICDLDDTLLTWYSWFLPAFEAMVSETIQILDRRRFAQIKSPAKKSQLVKELKEELYKDCQKINTKYLHIEQPFALLETKYVRSRMKGKPWEARQEKLAPAFDKFDAVRKRHCKPYSRVLETLQMLKTLGIKIIAVSGGRFFTGTKRLERSGVLECLDALYIREPADVSVLSRLKKSEITQKYPDIRFCLLPGEEMKPMPDLVYRVCNDEGLDPQHVAVVGDSSRDMLLGENVRPRPSFKILADYAPELSPEEKRVLKRLSGQTQADLDVDKRIAVHFADWIAQKSFAEILLALGQEEAYRKVMRSRKKVA